MTGSIQATEAEAAQTQLDEGNPDFSVLAATMGETSTQYIITLPMAGRRQGIFGSSQFGRRDGYTKFGRDMLQRRLHRAPSHDGLCQQTDRGRTARQQPAKGDPGACGRDDPSDHHPQSRHHPALRRVSAPSLLRHSPLPLPVANQYTATGSTAQILF